MKRRTLLTSSLPASALALSPKSLLGGLGAPADGTWPQDGSLARAVPAGANGLLISAATPKALGEMVVRRNAQVWHHGAVAFGALSNLSEIFKGLLKSRLRQWPFRKGGSG